MLELETLRKGSTIHKKQTIDEAKKHSLISIIKICGVVDFFFKMALK